jgi:hypothetical protein
VSELELQIKNKPFLGLLKNSRIKYLVSGNSIRGTKLLTVPQFDGRLNARFAEEWTIFF